MANNLNGDHLQDSDKEIDYGIITSGILLGSDLMLHIIRSLLVSGLLRISSCCIPGVDPMAGFLHSCVFLTCAPYLAPSLAKALRARANLSFTSPHEIFVHVWVLGSAACLFFRYMLFFLRVADSLQFIECSVSCATDSKSFVSAVKLGVVFSLVFNMIFIICRLSAPRR